MIWCLIIAFVPFLGSASYIGNRQNEIEGEGGLYLAINALAFIDDDGNTVKRRLEVDFFGFQVSKDDLVTINLPDSEPITFVPSEFPDGYYISSKQLPYPTFDEMNFVRTCVFGINATWERGDGTVVAQNCLQSEPSWMWDHRNELQYMNIGDMMLIGAHDAGAYRDYQGVGDDNWATSAVFAQEEDLLHQLMWGVRFVDIRCGFYPTTEERFWLVHGIIKTHPMIEGIEDVKTFLKNTQEIVVWEINDFCNREGLAEGEGRIIITYNIGYTDKTIFFPEVFERWGNVDEPEVLREYLTREVANAENNPGYQPWKPNCQMTPNQEDIIGGRWSGLREMANAVNRNVTAWWRDDWPDLPSTFPIHDFVRSTNMVQESIERNLRLAESLKK